MDQKERPPLFHVGRVPRLLWVFVCLYFVVLAVQGILQAVEQPGLQWDWTGPTAGLVCHRAGEVLWFGAGALLGLKANHPVCFVIHVLGSAFYIMWLSKVLPVAALG